jgi:L-lactate dehydrogenase complex protein LldG
MPEAVNHRDHRSRILSSIRNALGDGTDVNAIAAEFAAIPRDYQQSNTASREAVLELFVDRLREYDAGVHEASLASIAGRIAEILNLRKHRAIAIPAGISPAWLPDGFEFAEAEEFDKLQLNKMDGILSGCTVAIAETGSIVLQNGPAQGPRLLSLVPDYHLCVVFAEQVVATVPEAFARLSATAHLPTTFISGPSATADIEMTRIKGVHGPRFFDVLIVTEKAIFNEALQA